MGRPHFIHSSPDECWVVSRLRVLKNPMCLCVQFCSLQGSTLGVTLVLMPRMLSAVIKFKQCFPQQTPGGPAKFAAGGQCQQGTPALIFAAPLTPAWSCYHNTRGASGSHAQCWGGAGWGGGLRPHTHQFPAVPPTSPLKPVHARPPGIHRGPPAPSAEAFPLPGGGHGGSQGTHAKARLNAHDLTAARGRNFGGTVI